MFGFWPNWPFVCDVWNKKKTSTYSSTVRKKLIMVMEQLVCEKEPIKEIHDRCNPHECKFRKHKENINIIWKNLETYQYSASQQTINDWVFWLQQYGVISGPSFPLLELNTGKYGPEITPYLDTFHAVNFLLKLVKIERNVNSNNYRNWTTCITRNAETHKSRNTLFL